MNNQNFRDMIAVLLNPLNNSNNSTNTGSGTLIRYTGESKSLEGLQNKEIDSVSSFNEAFPDYPKDHVGTVIKDVSNIMVQSKQSYVDNANNSDVTEVLDKVFTNDFINKMKLSLSTKMVVFSLYPLLFN